MEHKDTPTIVEYRSPSGTKDPARFFVGVRPSDPPRGTGAFVRPVLFEPSVRFWWLMGAVILIAATAITISQLVVWQREASLMRDGIKTTALIMEEGATFRGRTINPANRVDVTYDVNGVQYKYSGLLPNREFFKKVVEGRDAARGRLVGGDSIEIRVDPANPRRWTNSVEPPPVLSVLVAPMVLLPIALLVLSGGAWQLRRLLATCGGGTGREAIVVDARLSALAPLSWTVRCTPREGADRSLATVYLPQRLGRPARGDVIWVASRSATRFADVLATAAYPAFESGGSAPAPPGTATPGTSPHSTP